MEQYAAIDMLAEHYKPDSHKQALEPSLCSTGTCTSMALASLHPCELAVTVLAFFPNPAACMRQHPEAQNMAKDPTRPNFHNKEEYITSIISSNFEIKLTEF